MSENLLIEYSAQLPYLLCGFVRNIVGRFGTGKQLHRVSNPITIGLEAMPSLLSARQHKTSRARARVCACCVFVYGVTAREDTSLIVTHQGRRAYSMGI